jgi:two-component system autoinducer 1 sensor kinase/phosphatase LuxN
MVGIEMARILVIEDDHVFRDLVRIYLRQIGYDVLTASNGKEGVEVFRSCPDLVDLVLTDLRMPVMTGNDAVRQIWHTRPDAKVICMTGSREDLHLTGIPVLTKPFSLKELRRSISHLIAPANDLGRRNL